MCFWYLEKSDLSSVHVYSCVHWTGHFTRYQQPWFWVDFQYLLHFYYYFLISGKDIDQVSSTFIAKVIGSWIWNFMAVVALSALFRHSVIFICVTIGKIKRKIFFISGIWNIFKRLGPRSVFFLTDTDPHNCSSVVTFCRVQIRQHRFYWRRVELRRQSGSTKELPAERRAQFRAYSTAQRQWFSGGFRRNFVEKLNFSWSEAKKRHVLSLNRSYYGCPKYLVTVTS